MIEYALVLPIVLLLILGIIDFGIAVFTFDTISNAAREGARAGIISGTSQQAVSTAALGLTTGLPGTTQVNILQQCENGVVQVEVRYQMSLIAGTLLLNQSSPTIPLRAVSTMRCE